MMDVIALLIVLAYLWHRERRREWRAFEQRVRLARPQPSYEPSERERWYADTLSGICRRGPDQNVVIELRSHARVAENEATS